MSICLSWCSLASQHPFYQPKKEFLLTERTKNHLRNPPGYAMLHVVGQKYKPFRYPHETSQTYVGRYLGQKQYLAGEVGEKLFNPTLMNKLISETFCFLSLLNSRYSNGFRFTKTNFFFDLYDRREPIKMR